jgi:hypothetical protein
MSGISSIGFSASALQSAMSGINQGMANLDADAQAIASGSVAGDPSAMTGALVDAQSQAMSVEIAAKAMTITNQTLGTLLDVLA